MRVGLLTEGGYPYATGEAGEWCDRLVRGLDRHEFDVYALSRGERQWPGDLRETPPHVLRVSTAPLWGPAPEPGRRRTSARRGRRESREFAAHFAELTAAVCATDGAGEADPAAEEAAGRFASGLRGLAALAAECGGLSGLLRSDTALRVLSSACRATGARQGAHEARLPDLTAVLDELERDLRPLSLPWYDDQPDGDVGLGGADLCHADSSGSAALAGLVAKRFFGVPLLVSEEGVRLREHYLSAAPARLSAPARALLASYRRRLAAEVYGQAALVVAGSTHVRRWQERCGADRARMRTVYAGMDAAPFAAVAGEESAPRSGPGAPAVARDEATLVWAGGRIMPAKDVIGLLHAFATVRRAEPGARLRIVESGAAPGPEAAAYAAHCRALAAQLFPDEAESAVVPGSNPVSFEELGEPGLATPADAYAAGCVIVSSSVVEGFPAGLVQAMLSGRATVSSDAGAVCEVIGGTGLVVPPRNPRALADACVALMRDPVRRARLGEAARARALELFTVEQNTGAFGGIYLELMSHWPVHRGEADGDERPLPFALPLEAHVPGRWTAGTPGPGQPAVAGGLPSARRVPSWAAAGAAPMAAEAASRGAGS